VSQFPATTSGSPSGAADPRRSPFADDWEEPDSPATDPRARRWQRAAELADDWEDSADLGASPVAVVTEEEEVFGRLRQPLGTQSPDEETGEPFAGEYVPRDEQQGCAAAPGPSSPPYSPAVPPECDVLPPRATETLPPANVDPPCEVVAPPSATPVSQTGRRARAVWPLAAALVGVALFAGGVLLGRGLAESPTHPDPDLGAVLAELKEARAREVALARSVESANERLAELSSRPTGAVLAELKEARAREEALARAVESANESLAKLASRPTVDLRPLEKSFEVKTEALRRSLEELRAGVVALGGAPGRADFERLVCRVGEFNDRLGALAREVKAACDSKGAREVVVREVVREGWPIILHEPPPCPIVTYSERTVQPYPTIYVRR
jgi:hypothetical protein